MNIYGLKNKLRKINRAIQHTKSLREKGNLIDAKAGISREIKQKREERWKQKRLSRR